MNNCSAKKKKAPKSKGIPIPHTVSIFFPFQDKRKEETDNLPVVKDVYFKSLRDILLLILKPG